MNSILAKIAPEAVKTLGSKAVLEIVGLTSIGAGAVNFGLDKGFEALRNWTNEKLEEEKKALMEKKAAVLEQKAEMAKKELEEVKEETPAEEPKKTSNNKKKNK